MRDRDPAALAGWRIDRRTFLKAMGLSGVGLVAGGVLGTRLAPFITPVAAQTSPIDDLALQLQFDAERIFRFVADEIRYQPYAGLLRGPEGTLMARAGNSVDQAALLAALLRGSGVEARFAQGPLDTTSSALVLSSAVTDAETARREVEAVLAGSGVGGRPFVPKVSEVELAARIPELSKESEQIAAWATAQMADTIALLGTALAGAGVTAPRDYSPMPALEQAQHTWVQAVAGPDWLDLDPTVPGARPGEAVTPAASLLDELPDELRHRVTLAVIGETVSHGALQQETLVEVDEFADGLAGVPIGIVNAEREGLKAVGANLVAGLEGSTTYLPAIIVGEHVVVGPGALRFGGSAVDPFGGLAAGTPGPAEGEPTGQWIETTIASPEGDPVVVRREIFDRIGPAARAGAGYDVSAIGPADLIEIAADSPPDFLPAQRMHWLTVHPGVLGGETLGRVLLEGSEVDEQFPRIVFGQHLLAEAMGLVTGLPLGVRTFTSGPNVAALTLDFEQGAGGGLVVQPVLDIWHRAIGTTPVDGVDQDAPAPLLAGIVPHVAERIVTGDAFAPSGTDTVPVSVGRIFEEADRAGIAITVLREAAAADALPIPTDARTRLASSLAQGWLAVVPEQPVRIGGAERVGWWLVDLETGRVEDQMDDGRGSSATENSAVQTVGFRGHPAFNKLAMCITMIALIGTALVRVGAGAGAIGIGARSGSSALGVAGTISMASGGASGVGGAYLAGLNCG